MSRRLARDTAFRALFQIDLGKCDPELALRHALEGVSLSAEEEQFVRELVLGAREKLAEIDALIRKRLINWDLSRVSAVERNLLRLALYEMLYPTGDSGSRFHQRSPGTGQEIRHQRRCGRFYQRSPGRCHGETV